jgi:hypothetical protein
METRKCARCGETKPIDKFGSHANQPLGKRYECRTCANAASAAWKKRNPEKNRAQAQRWRDRNPEKAKEMSLRSYAKNRDKIIARAVKYGREHPEAKHDHYLRHAYGVPHGTYARLLAEQDGKCAICGTSEPGSKQKRFHLDHCHETQTVRGLLCMRCNTGIGHLDHRVEILLSAIRYLSAKSPAI